MLIRTASFLAFNHAPSWLEHFSQQGLQMARVAQDARPLSKRNKFRQVSDLHFLHHPMAVDLDCTFGPPNAWAICLLVCRG